MAVISSMTVCQVRFRSTDSVRMHPERLHGGDGETVTHALSEDHFILIQQVVKEMAPTIGSAGRTEYLRGWNSTRIQRRLGYLSPDEYLAHKLATA